MSLTKSSGRTDLMWDICVCFLPTASTGAGCTLNSWKRTIPPILGMDDRRILRLRVVRVYSQIALK